MSASAFRRAWHEGGAENDAAFTVPLTVLATAAAVTEHSMLRLLTRHPAFEPVDLEWTRWPALAAAFGRWVGWMPPERGSSL